MPPKSERAQYTKRTPGLGSASWPRGMVASFLGGCQALCSGAWALRACLTLVVTLLAGQWLAPVSVPGCGNWALSGPGDAHANTPQRQARDVEPQVSKIRLAEALGAKLAVHDPAPNRPEPNVGLLDEGVRYEPEPSELGALEDDAPELLVFARYVQATSHHDDQTVYPTLVAPGAQRSTPASCPRGPPLA